VVVGKNFGTDIYGFEISWQKIGRIWNRYLRVWNFLTKI